MYFKIVAEIRTLGEKNKVGERKVSADNFRRFLFLNTELMNTWVKKSDEWWNTGFAPKPAKEKVKKTGNSTNAI